MADNSDMRGKQSKKSDEATKSLNEFAKGNDLSQNFENISLI